MTQTPGEPVTRPTPSSVAAAAPFEDVSAVTDQPGRSLPAALGSRGPLVGSAALAAGVALVAALVVRRRAAAGRRWQRRLPLR